MAVNRAFGSHWACAGVLAGLLAIGACVGPEAGQALGDLARVTEVTTQQSSAELRVSVHVTAPVRYALQRVRPDWIVVDLLGAALATASGTLPFSGGAVARIRIGQFAPTVVRVVVELTRPLKYQVAPAPDQTAVVITLSENPVTPAAGAAAPDEERIIYGQSIGRLRLGMPAAEVLAALGAAAATTSLPGLGTDYLWYSGSRPAGLGVRATAAGIVGQIWIVGDSGYRTPEGLHVGSSEAEVRTALGPPSWTVAVSSQDKTTTLMYDRLGVWFVIRPDDRPALPGRVSRIDVVAPSTASGAPSR